MDSAGLPELQAPLKAKYREDSGAAVVMLRARGDLADDAIVCKVETGRPLIEAGLHPVTGGTASKSARVICCSKHSSPAPA